MDRKMLSPEERAEYDAVYDDAVYDSNGAARPTGAAGDELIRLLQDARQGGRTWADYELDDLLHDGADRAASKHLRAGTKNEVMIGGKRVKRSAIASVQREVEGQKVWQPSLFEEMTREELRDYMRAAGARIESERIGIAVARRTLELLDRVPDATTAREACVALGINYDEYLRSGAA